MASLPPVLEQLNNSSTSELILGLQYKAKIDSVYPLSARTNFEQFDSCFLGVSLENSSFQPAKVKAMVEWISRRFSHCLVLVGDSIHRINIELTRSLDPETALVEALEIGHAFVQEHKYIFKAFGEQTKFTFNTCSQIQTWEDYAHFHQYLQIYFKSNTKFRSSVEAFSRNYQIRRSSNQSDTLLEQRIRRSCDYFLEEFAIFACLQKRGFSVMVYPGTFSTLTEIVNEDYPDILEEIKQLIIVSLHFKKRSLIDNG
ncbi:MAG: tRNA-dependent cyclodipeptide synthase [Okeania sp. SIO3B5]|uniref:tRNA-dependent cyclodipeptide synthase n=1 Tax=Okeania sp. SIO3B5 TaxID=2607811 RepID=UPI0013FFB6BF|nr:tRNA-dependent cyclodipeptide synthase [Okeania sp. SIO3B5]NEO57361.1 tRNA-dependent cyclodipeptide synthase [Okeania sp. SIO3B5]